MSYQFDPSPEGLQYEPLKLTFTSSMLWFLRDEAPEPWIDLRSIFEIVGAPWMGRWKRYCLSKQLAWGLEACTDRKMRENLLAPANQLAEILSDLEQEFIRNGLQAYADLASRLRTQWRTRLYQTVRRAQSPIPSAPLLRNTRTSKGKSRVTSYVVNQIFLLTQKGHSRAGISQALHLSPGTISLVVSGKYPSLDSQAKAAWQDTFGRVNISQRV